MTRGSRMPERTSDSLRRAALPSALQRNRRFLAPSRPLGRAVAPAAAAAILATSVCLFVPAARAQTAAAGETLPASPSAGRDGSPATPAELQRQINELRSDILDDRERRLDSRQAVHGAALVVLVIAVGIGTVLAYSRFRAIAAERRLGTVAGGARASRMGNLAAPARTLLGPPGQELQVIPVLLPKGEGAVPGDLGRTAGTANGVAVSLEQAVRRALASRDGDEAAGPAGGWPVLTLVAAASDSDPAAKPSLSSAYLPGPAPSREAMPHSDPAMRPDPDSRPNGRGDADEQRLRSEQAVAACTEAIRDEPDEARHYLERGEALSELDRHEEALADYDLAIGLDPGNAAAYLGRCHAKADLGRHDEAIDDFEEAVRLDPDLASRPEDE